MKVFTVNVTGARTLLGTRYNFEGEAQVLAKDQNHAFFLLENDIEWSNIESLEFKVESWMDCESGKVLHVSKMKPVI